MPICAGMLANCGFVDFACSSTAWSWAMAGVTWRSIPPLNVKCIPSLDSLNLESLPPKCQSSLVPTWGDPPNAKEPPETFKCLWFPTPDGSRGRSVYVLTLFIYVLLLYSVFYVFPGWKQKCNPARNGGASMCISMIHITTIIPINNMIVTTIIISVSKLIANFSKN